jgi:hypothetical protein
MIPLRSYADPPSDNKFTNSESFELRLNNVSCLLLNLLSLCTLLLYFQYVVPSVDTTYHCKVYKAPTTFPLKRHAVAV